MNDAFCATRSFEKIRFDDTGRQMLLVTQDKIYAYDALRGYALLEETGIGKGFARAYSVGLLSSLEGVRSVSAMRVRLVFDSAEEFLDLMITPAKTNSIVYKSLAKTAAQILDKLREICPENCADAGADYTEELRRLRRLADDGVITEADFEAKKKQLLGL